MKKRVVLVDQLQNPRRENVGKPYGLINDAAAAKRFGARNLKEYSYWAWRACALADVYMILRAEKLFDGTLFDLVKMALKLNGYAFKNRRGGVDIGWRHDALVKILQSMGMQAKAVILDYQQLMAEVDSGRYVVASLKSKSGGHMVLIKDGVWYDPHVLTQISQKKDYLGKAIISWR